MVQSIIYVLEEIKDLTEQIEQFHKEEEAALEDEKEAPPPPPPPAPAPAPAPAPVPQQPQLPPPPQPPPQLSPRKSPPGYVIDYCSIDQILPPTARSSKTPRKPKCFMDGWRKQQNLM